MLFPAPYCILKKIFRLLLCVCPSLCMYIFMWLTLEARRGGWILCLPLRALRLQGHVTLASCGFWGLNSGPQACGASISQASTTPAALNLVFKSDPV